MLIYNLCKIISLNSIISNCVAFTPTKLDFPSSSFVRLIVHELFSYEKSHFLATLWFSSLISIFILSLIFSFVHTGDSRVLGASISLSEDETETYASLPSIEPTIENQINFKDARTNIIKNYLAKYNAPPELQNEADFLVQESDEKGVDPRFIVAIARKESTFCKNMAKLPDGSPSNNCGGLGIFGKTLTSFSSIHDWIEAEINFMKNGYISKGITDTCEIEKTHTPPAKGVWCNAINTYISEMQ